MWTGCLISVAALLIPFIHQAASHIKGSTQSFQHHSSVSHPPASIVYHEQVNIWPPFWCCKNLLRYFQFMSRYLIWLTLCKASACFGQDDAESCRPNLLVPSAQICFANTEEGADAEDLQIEKGKYWNLFDTHQLCGFFSIDNQMSYSGLPFSPYDDLIIK